MKAATVEKVIELVNQAVSSSYIWSESIISKVKTNMKLVKFHSFRLKWKNTCNRLPSVNDGLREN